MMYTVTKFMTTETAHRLCNYAGKCAHIHGHSYRWEVTAAREDGGISPDNGISIDFGELKGAMREVIYNRFDHALVLWVKDPLGEFAWQMSTEPQHEFAKAADGTAQKIVFMKDNPTAEVFAEFVAKELQRLFFGGSDDNVEIEILRVKVWETADSYGQWSKGGLFTSARNLQK